MGVQVGAPTILSDYWISQGIKGKTIRARLRAFEDVGGLAATRESVQSYLAGFSNPRTRRLRLSMLRVTFRLAIALELIDRDPTVLIGRMRVPRSMPKPLSPSELQLLLSAASPRVQVFTTLAAYAGLRACEIAQVTFDDVESYPGGWRLRIRSGKGGHEAVVPAHPKVVAALRQWRRPEGLTANAVSKACQLEFRRLGIEGGIHRARHSYATNCLRVSGDILVVRDLMRHASVATTQIYTALADDRPASVIAALA